MQAQVKAWGNGQGVRFSKELLNSIGIHLNDYLNVDVVDGGIMLTKDFRHKSLEERTAEFGGKLGPYDEFVWSDAEGREVW